MSEKLASCARWPHEDPKVKAASFGRRPGECHLSSRQCTTKHNCTNRLWACTAAFKENCTSALLFRSGAATLRVFPLTEGDVYEEGGLPTTTSWNRLFCCLTETYHSTSLWTHFRTRWTTIRSESSPGDSSLKNLKCYFKWVTLWHLCFGPQRNIWWIILCFM